MKKLLNEQRGSLFLPIIIGVLAIGSIGSFAFFRVQQTQFDKKQKASDVSLQQKLAEADLLKQEAKLKAETKPPEDKPVELPATEKPAAPAPAPKPTTTTTKTETKTTYTKPAPAQPTGSLNLQHVSGANVAWTLNGNAPYGLKLVWSTSPGPVYPGASAKYFSGASTTSATIEAGAGSYYVRVCMYYEGKCMNYSNEIFITVP